VRLGAFSVSLPVADLAVSLAFYRTLGFEQVGGDADENWVVLRHDETVFGLFQGMFDEPILTFNPGIDQRMRPLADFTDVREIQSRLADAGVDLVEATDPNGTGPAHIVLTDPDGHRIMVDQFADRPGTASKPDRAPH
jgi:catechol 2,3-dioxygenase-like lactoylglutathione lyase family enzyme